jgi:N-acetylglutamate synthase-like GNAT family acetyltransferase
VCDECDKVRQLQITPDAEGNVIKIHNGLRPGDLGYVIYLHGSLYSKEYNLDHTFEGEVAAKMGDFAKQFDPAKDFFAVAEDEGQIIGSIAINGLGDTRALLRWFLLRPNARGKGLGKKLLHDALNFCRERHFTTVNLWTISELTTAAHLYRQVGFQIVEENTREFWGALRTEQRYELTLR